MSTGRNDDERIFGALGGGMAFELLRAASAIGLFALLRERPKLRREEIAAALGIEPYAVEVLLLGLVPLRLIRRQHDRYSNDPAVTAALAQGVLERVIDFMHQVINPAMRHLEASVRSARPVGLRQVFGEGVTGFYEALGRDPRRGECFRRAMAADTERNRDRVASHPVFAGARRILDVGGGTGEMAIALQAHHPHIHVTVVDLPDVAARAFARFQALGCYPKLDAVPCDLRIQPLPRGHDAVLFAHVLDIFGRQRMRQILAAAEEALEDGGTVTIFGSVMDDDESGPLTYGVLSSYFLCLAEGEGRFYTAADHREALQTAGFSKIETTALPHHEVLITGHKHRANATRSAPTKRLPPSPTRISPVVALVRLGRPKFLVYSLLFYGLGTTVRLHEGGVVRLGPWIHGLGLVVAAHLMTHYVNEYFDLNADLANTQPTRWTGGSRVLVDGHVAPAVSLLAGATLAIAATGLALCMPTRSLVCTGLVLIVLGWSYTAPPGRLNYRGFGELTVASVLALAVPILGYGSVRPSRLLLGILVPLFLAQTARMVTMNLADVDGDRRAGKTTLAVWVGPRVAPRAVAIGQAVAYGSILGLTAARVLPVAVGAPMFATLPVALWVVGQVRRGALQDPARANGVVFWASAHIALLTAAAMLAVVILDVRF